MTMMKKSLENTVGKGDYGGNQFFIAAKLHCPEGQLLGVSSVQLFVNF